MEKSLKEKILNELAEKEDQRVMGQSRQVNSKEILERNSALAKEFVAINENGKINFTNKSRYNVMEKITLYLIGKQYAKYQGLADNEYATNDELISEIGISYIYLVGLIRTFKAKNTIEFGPRKGKKATYAIAIEAIEPELKAIKDKSVANLSKLRRE